MKVHVNGETYLSWLMSLFSYPFAIAVQWNPQKWIMTNWLLSSFDKSSTRGEETQNVKQHWSVLY